MGMRLTRTCSVEDCEAVVHARGWCRVHWNQWKAGDPPGEVVDMRKRERPVRTCFVEDCDSPVHCNGMCQRHNARWKKYGDPLAVQLVGKAAPAYGSGRSDSGGNGYIRRWMPGHPLAMGAGYVYEHRLVLWEAGFDSRGFAVHHLNHDKTDNRLENLEVLTRSEHQRRHLREAGFVKNQFGTWSLWRVMA